MNPLTSSAVTTLIARSPASSEALADRIFRFHLAGSSERRWNRVGTICSGSRAAIFFFNADRSISFRSMNTSMPAGTARRERPADRDHLLGSGFLAEDRLDLAEFDPLPENLYLRVRCARYSATARPRTAFGRGLRSCSAVDSSRAVRGRLFSFSPDPSGSRAKLGAPPSGVRRSPLRELPFRCSSHTSAVIPGLGYPIGTIPLSHSPGDFSGSHR